MLPCYNPLPGWEQIVVDEWKALAERLGFQPGLLLVNDGSSSGVKEAQLNFLVDQIPTFRYIVYSPNRGKGYALRKGVAESVAECCIYTDVDFPYTQDSLTKIVQELKNGTAVVAGIKDSAYYDKVPPMRQRVSRFLRWLIRNFFRMKVADTQCGLKGFNREGRELFLSCTIDRYLFDLEFLYKTSRSDLSLEPVEIHLREGVIFSKLKPWVLATEAFNFFKVLLGSLR